jgi:hypothetical protein
VQIELSTDNGSTWSGITPSPTPNDGEYSWTIPDTPSSQCLVRIKEAADGNPSDTSDAVFSIVKTPTLQVTSPNGGESWETGTAHNITWQSEGTVGNVSIELSTDNGSTWSPITSSPTPNDGEYSWTVPDNPASQCLVRLKEAADGNPSDTSDAVFSIVKTPTIQIISPNGGENWEIGTEQNITWTSINVVGNVKIELSTNNGSTWSTIASSTANDGIFSWTVPDTPSTKCRVRIKEASDGSPSDTSDSTFSIVSPSTSTLTVISPNGGESWDTGTTHSINWTSTGNVGNVKIELSTDNGGTWSTIVSSTANDGIYSWTISANPSTQCMVRITDISDTGVFDDSDNVFSIISVTPPTIALNRTQLNFGADTNGTVTDPQTFLIENSGGGTLTWNVSDNVNWMASSPDFGTNSGIVTVYVNPSGLSPGIYNGIITVSDPEATNSPHTINVMLNVFKPEDDEFPFGTFETPLHGSTVRSSIPVTGWVLDDIQVEKVEIWGKIMTIYAGGEEYWEDFYIGQAIFVEGARPDAEEAYPGYPMNYQAGWGYMMLTNFLPNQGNGTYIIYAKAIDKTGKEVILGEKTIYCDNANAVKPFGAIDTPAPGGIVSGQSYSNTGWALTSLPNKIPEDGSTINVYIDGVNLGHPQYNIYRADIANYFPGYANSNGALARFDFDTTAYSNGIHTIMWTAQDNAGNADGIGSRYFSIQNTNTGRISGKASNCRAGDLIPGNPGTPIRIKKGFAQDAGHEIISPDEYGTINIETEELERIEIQLSDKISYNSTTYGCQIIGDQLRALPIGSTYDMQNQIFYWQPGPGFIGEYQLVFVDKTDNLVLRKININILPKHSK